MYDVLALSMKIAGRPKDDIDRVLSSRIDLTGTDVPSMLYTAAHFARFGGDDLALHLYRQASRLAPARPEPYILGLRLARKLKDYDAIRWAAPGILTTAWSSGHRDLHKQAEDAALEARRELTKAGRETEADTIEAAMAEARQRDMVLRLAWSGEGDLDLIVEEPPGTVCSATDPFSPGGGVLAHDGFGPDQKNCYEEYVCARGVPGKYRVRIRHVHGNIVGKRAQLTVTRRLGTPEESVRTFVVPLEQDDALVRLSLPAGRRTELAPVPPRPDYSTLIPSRHRGSLLQMMGGRTGPSGARAGARFAASRRRPMVTGSVGFTPVVSVISEGVTLSAMAVVSGDRRYVRLSTAPFFSTLTDVFTFSFVNTGNPTGNPGVGGGGGGAGAGGVGGGLGAGGGAAGN